MDDQVTTAAAETTPEPTTTTEPAPVAIKTAPKYSKDPLIDGIQHLGHWLHIGVKDAVWDGVVIIHRGIVVTEDLKSQFPTLAAEVATVAGDVIQCKALAAAIALAVAGEGLNLAADAGVLAALVKDGPAIIQLFANAGKLLKTLSGDIVTDLHAIEGK